MAKKCAPKVPTLPHNFWRKLYALLESRPYKLNMALWHGGRTGNDLEPEEVMDRKRNGTDCNTTHCMAGFTTYLTPGGLKFETTLVKRAREDYESLRPLRDALENTDFNSCDVDHTAGAAALILMKSGWYRYFTSSDFHTDNETALKKIKRLAQLEARREKGTLKWKESKYANL